MDSNDLAEIPSIFFERDFTNFDTLEDVEFFDCFRLLNDSKYIIASYTFDHTHKDFIYSYALTKERDKTIYDYSLDGLRCTVTTLVPNKKYHFNPLVNQQEAHTKLLAKLHLLGAEVSKLFITQLDESNPSKSPPGKGSPKRRILVGHTIREAKHARLQLRLDNLKLFEGGRSRELQFRLQEKLKSIEEGRSMILNEFPPDWNTPKPPKANRSYDNLSPLGKRDDPWWVISSSGKSSASSRLIDLPTEEYAKLFEPPRPEKGTSDVLFDLEDTEYFGLFVPSKEEEDIIVKASAKSAEPVVSDSTEVTREAIPPYEETHEYVSDEEKESIVFSTDDEEDCVVRLSNVSIEDFQAPDTKTFVLLPTKEEEEDEGGDEIWQVDVPANQSQNSAGEADIETQSSTSFEEDSDYVTIFTYK